MMAVAFVVILGRLAIICNEQFAFCGAREARSLLQFARGLARMTLPKTRGGRRD